MTSDQTAKTQAYIDDQLPAEDFEDDELIWTAAEYHHLAAHHFAAAAKHHLLFTERLARA